MKFILAIKKKLSSIPAGPAIAFALALAGALVYLAYSIHFAIYQRSTIDEGLFLYKGYLFASGAYNPFQEFGPRTFYGPLSYLVPGWLQVWFGRGLLTGRITAIFFGLLTLVGLWAACRRLVGNWWAAFIIWAACLNPAVIRFYSFGLSQGLVACLLVWMIFFATNRTRSLWQAGVSATLAALALLTRQNMLPVLPIIIAYIFWQHGRKAGLAALLTGSLIFLAGNLVFWPGILANWAPWLPASLTPFLDPWRLPAGLKAGLQFETTSIARLYSLLEGFRFHFLALVGSILSLVVWPARKFWKSDRHFKAAVFLAVLFFSLLILNAWVGLGFNQGNNRNAFTFNPYLAFFSYAGLLLSAVVFSNFQRHISTARQVIATILIVILSTGVGFGGYESTGNTILALTIPRIRNFFSTGRFIPGNVPLWDFLNNKFGLSYQAARWMLPTLAGLAAGLLVLVIGLIIRSRLKHRFAPRLFSFGSIIISIFLLAGLLLSPSIVLGGGFTQWECNSKVIAAYQQAGKDLAGVLSPGDLIYWDGGNAVAILLYTDSIRIEPQELDGDWNYFLDGNSQELTRLGYWNPTLAAQWRQQADVIILQNGYYDSAWQAFFDQHANIGLLRTEQMLNCSPDSFLQVYRIVK